MANLLEGRVGFITGAGRGLGRQIALRFAAEGAFGLAADLPGSSGGTEAVHGFEPIACDVAREEDLAAAMEAVAIRFGRLDWLVANAGLVPPWRETDAIDLAEWQRVMAVNAAGVAATLKHAVPLMKRVGGSIVIMASINGTSAHPRQMLYTASKHAVLGIMRAAALDLGRYAIRVNALAPGPIATDALRSRVRGRTASAEGEAEALAAMASQTALGRLATAEEVAKAALFLVSDLSSGISGAVLPVDAGLP